MGQEMSETTSETFEQQGDATETGSPDWEAEVSKWKSLSRKNEEAAKANASKAKEYDSFVESQKTEAQRKDDALKATEARAAAAEARLAKAEAALKYKNLTAEDLELLGSGTPEEIDARAKRLSERLTPPAPNFDGGSRKSAGSPQNMNDVIRKAAGLG